MNAILQVISIERTDLSTSIFDTITHADQAIDLVIKAGTILAMDGIRRSFDVDTPVQIAGLVPGQDYGVRIGDEGKPVAVPIAGDIGAMTFGGFHFAPSGNALSRAGGNGIPEINRFSCWDAGFRPACQDPRGMALVDGKFWADIYLLGTDHIADGTSRCGAVIADGESLPAKLDGKGKYKRVDYATAVEIYSHHGKGLLGAEEFFAAAYGTTERTACDAEPKVTGDLSDGRQKFVSKWGLFDVTGTMWQWGTDGDSDNPRASLFGGSWLYGVDAGSRCADLDSWPGNSYDFFSARGRSDHLKPVA